VAWALLSVSGKSNTFCVHMGGYIWEVTLRSLEMGCLYWIKYCFIQAAAKDVGQKVVSMVLKVSDLLLEKVEVGDPPVAITLGKIGLDVRKKLARDVESEGVSSHIGRHKIHGKLDVSAGTCVQSRVGLGRLKMRDWKL